MMDQNFKPEGSYHHYKDYGDSHWVKASKPGKTAKNGHSYRVDDSDEEEESPVFNNLWKESNTLTDLTAICEII